MLRRISPGRTVPASKAPEHAVLQFMAAHLAGGLRIPTPLLLKPDLARSGWNSLLAEARETREKSFAHGGGGQAMAHAGPVANDWVSSAQTARWIQEHTGLAVCENVEASYIYYEAGSFCPLHMDRPRSNELNLLMVLDHKVSAGNGASLTYAITPDGPLWFQLVPGEALLFHSTHTIHGRTPLAVGEAIVVLSTGFLIEPSQS
jgi:hypothetical protein